MADELTCYEVIRFRCSKLMKNRLKRIKRKRGCTLSDVVRSACLKYVNDFEEKEKCL